MKRLIMFTAAYPYDRMNIWKGQELRAFQEFFDEVFVSPLYQKQGELSPDLPQDVRVLPPVFPLGAVGRPVPSRIATLFNSRLLRNIARTEPVSRIVDFRRYWAAVADLEEIYRSEAWRNHIAPLLSGSTLYFFWGRGYAAVLPDLAPAQRNRSLVRLHRWDLYPEANDGYVPYQRRIVEAAGVIAPVSRNGSELLTKMYPAQADKIKCLKLGTELGGLSRPSDDSVFRIVSCAYARPVKRLHLIPEALRDLDFPVSWTHMGDGPEMPLIREACSYLPPNVEINLLGTVEPEVVPQIYVQGRFDLFINVSASEGIPVSIMEAMSAGIPVLATDVGGNGEIVDRETGRVLSAEITAIELRNAILDMRAMPPSKRQALRIACRRKIECEYDQAKNARAVARTLLALK